MTLSRVGLLVRAMTILGVVIGVVAAPAAASPKAQEPGTSGLSDTAQRFRDDLGVPGVAMQVVDTRGPVDTAMSGQDGNDRPITDTTPFVWGSVSKSFTATVISRLAARGELSLAEPVVRVLPEARDAGLPGDVTIDELVHHTSGLEHDLQLTDDWDRRGSAIDAVRGWPRLTVHPRGEFRYSSLNYLLLQAIVEKVTGAPFGQSVAADVGQPSGARDVIADAATFSREVPPGHLPFFGVAATTDTGVDAAGLGYGYLAGSVTQLGRYASWQLRELASSDRDAVMRRDDLVPTTSGTQYGFGWYVERMTDSSGRGHEVRWHSGAVPGYFTHVALIPDAGRALVVVANRYGELESTQLAAAARSVVGTQLGDELALPSTTFSEYHLVLAVAIAVIVLLLVWVVRVVVTLWQRDLVSRSTRAVLARVVLWGVVGGALLALFLVGIPTAVGAPVPVLSRWAPDVGLLFWILLAEIFLTAALLILRAVTEHERFRSP